MTTTVQPGDGVASPGTNGNPLHRLTEEQLEELAREFQAIHDEVYADLGEQDAHYIRSTIQFHHRLTLLSRILLMASHYRPAWILGTVGLSAAKIIENMEIGHNVMHGQWDWMNDPYHPLLDLGLGRRLARRRLEALPQLCPPHLHQRHRQGP